MFNHLLIATDGSPLSERAVVAGIELAKRVGARITAVHVSPRFHVLTYRSEMLEETRSEYERDTQIHAEKYLDFVAKAAQASQVRCDTLRKQSDNVAQSIVDAAQSNACDLIVMASHGRSGAARILLGSETQRVLVHSTIPVLVCR
jgi:nucleotide-binding universal stress UspA family protein